MTEQLKACPVPWCGKSRPEICQGGFRNTAYVVRCRTCGTTAPRFYSPQQAIAAWNTRAAPEADAWQPIPAPVQDDDAEWLRKHGHALVYGGLPLRVGVRIEAQKRLERIAARLATRGGDLK